VIRAADAVLVALKPIERGDHVLLTALSRLVPVEPLIVREQTSVWVYVCVGLFASAITALVIGLVMVMRRRDRTSRRINCVPAHQSKRNQSKRRTEKS
jgi:hypothetical protein